MAAFRPVVSRDMLGSMLVAASSTRSPLRTLRVIASDIKLAHSVFAMPFALLAAFMAGLPCFQGICGTFLPQNWRMPTTLDQALERHLPGKLLLIIVAMVFARSTAMLFNRLLDRDIDQHNPRTAGRALPSERISSRTAVLVLVMCAVAFVNVCACFGWFYLNWWPLYMSVPVLSWISAYPLLKRFTMLCHIYLGSSLALSPIAAAIAIDPSTVSPGAWSFQPALWLLAGMVLCWVAGFDIIYALQDVDVDRAQNLHSIPARLGVPRALWIARTLHALAVACLIASLFIDPRFGVLFAIGIALVAALLIYEHLTVARWGTSKIALTFFTLNGLISCVLGTLGIIDILL
jgi:4-hydroxybenzoate polyprenyltransferase